MTPTTTILLGILNLALIGALPRIFFRRGRLTLAWWMTASPFFASAAVLGLAMFGLTRPLAPPHTIAQGLATALHAGSVLLIGFTLGTHREPLSLWHQEGDTPHHLVTHGAYARIRHPFYSAFLLALVGAALSHPHWATVGAALFGAVQLNRTAAREEALIGASDLAAEYQVYVRRTGRFCPPAIGLLRPSAPARESEACPGGSLDESSPGRGPGTAAV